MIADKMLRPGRNHTVCDSNLRPQRFKSFDMLVNGAAANVTAPGKYYGRLLIFAQKSAQKVIRTSDFLNGIPFHHKAVDKSPVGSHRMPVYPFHMCANALHGL